MTDETLLPDEETVIEDVIEDEEPVSELSDDTEQEAEAEIEMTTFVGDDGVEYEVPASLAPSLMKNKDYTSKTQQLAEQRKALEAERESWAAQQKRDEEDFKIEAELLTLQQRLKSYENVDWHSLRMNDPDAANAHFQDMTILKDQVQRAGQTKAERAAQRSQAFQESFGKRLEETVSFARQNIPNWDNGVEDEVTEFIKKSGLTEDFLRSNLSPTLLKILHGAYTAEKIQQKAATPKAQAKPNIMPLRQVKAKSGTTTRKDPDNMSMAEYRAWRKRAG